MKADQQKFNAALMEAVNAVNDVITISKKAKRIGTIRQFFLRIRNSRISIKTGRKKRSASQACMKTASPGNCATRSPYSVYPC